jgi:hypothetical protein
MRGSARNDHVNDLDTGEWQDDAADAVNQHVAAKQLASRRGPIADTTSRKRNQRDYDQRVEDDSR